MSSRAEVQVEQILSPADIPAAFEVDCKAFGEQTNDGIWTTVFPRWNTSGGKQQAIDRIKVRLQSDSRNKDGQLNTILLKATVPDRTTPAAVPQRRVIAGFAIWMQASAVPGHGETLLENEISDEELELLYPDDAREQKYLRQLLLALHKRRREVVQEKTNDKLPAVFVLDSCAVDPAFQRMGIASELVRWGKEEAKRRGGLECITEASSMGRYVYEKSGFVPEGDDMIYEVDDEFATRARPPNLFMRTFLDTAWS